MANAYIFIKCAEDDCPLNRRYDGYILLESKKMDFNSDSIPAVHDQLSACGFNPVFKPICGLDHAIVEAKNLGFEVEL